MTGAVRRGWRAVSGFLAVQEELHARAALAARPWEEEFLHWSGGELHGSLPRPRRWGPGTTPAGWCPGAAAPARAGARSGRDEPDRAPLRR
ncbi:hypothetical protein [Modestobacter sp. NPDC049651]|uniref:hypothetical protein n=1 Tax=unclassified Modestobacter TaxID=2643866 RepID=UPI0033F554CB